MRFWGECVCVMVRRFEQVPLLLPECPQLYYIQETLHMVFRENCGKEFHSETSSTTQNDDISRIEYTRHHHLQSTLCCALQTQIHANTFALVCIYYIRIRMYNAMAKGIYFKCARYTHCAEQKTAPAICLRIASFSWAGTLRAYKPTHTQHPVTAYSKWRNRKRQQKQCAPHNRWIQQSRKLSLTHTVSYTRRPERNKMQLTRSTLLRWISSQPPERFPPPQANCLNFFNNNFV